MSKKIMILVNHDIVIYNFRRELVEQLIEQGYEIHISCPYGSKIDYFKDLGCSHHDIRINRHGMNPKEEYNLFKSYYDLIKNVRPDLVLSYTIKPNIYGGLASKLQGVPYIPNVTGLGTALFRGKLKSKVLLKMYLITLNNANWTYFQNIENYESLKFSGYKKSNYNILPGSGVNTSQFTFTDYPVNEKLNILYIGRLMQDKGSLELLKAFEDIDYCDLNIIGFSDDEYVSGYLENLLESSHNITYSGFKDDVRQYIEKSDAVILPSYHEGMSNVLLEAASMGRPLLGSNIAGVREIVLHEKNGFLFEPKSAEAIKKCVYKFSTLSNHERKSFGLKSREHIVNNFNRNSIIEIYTKRIGAILND